MAKKEEAQAADRAEPFDDPFWSPQGLQPQADPEFVDSELDFELVVEESPASEPPGRRDKYVYLVRHAQSTWNRHMEDIRRAPSILSDPSQARSALQGAVALTRELSHGLLVQEGHTDHKLSELGETQAQQLGQILSSRDMLPEMERRIYYDNLFGKDVPIFCSPMLRAVQTAHLALPEDAGWGPMVLLKDAREVFNNWAERDCVGGAEGRGIVQRAMAECGLPGLERRVDWSRSDCEQGRWWSEATEAEDSVNERLDSLLRKLLDEDEAKSCVCVTHSNLIRRLLMRYGAVGSDPDGSTSDDGTLSVRDGFAMSFTSDGSWEELNCTPTTLQRCKVEKLQNCGVLGVHFVKRNQSWVARDVCMMFGTKLEHDMVES
jgi:broad specificity phosphatase PhoE